jgi:hypothetical protein
MASLGRSVGARAVLIYILAQSGYLYNIFDRRGCGYKPGYPYYIKYRFYVKFRRFEVNAGIVDLQCSINRTALVLFLDIHIVHLAPEAGRGTRAIILRQGNFPTT